MLRQKTGPATIAANNTSASMPSSSCSRTRCSGPPVPAASATLRPNGCQVPAALPARRSRKLASKSGWPSIIKASPPSGRCTVCGARSRCFSGTRWIQRSGGTSRCPSADISLYCLGIPPSVELRKISLASGDAAGHPPRTPGGSANPASDNQFFGQLMRGNRQRHFGSFQAVLVEPAGQSCHILVMQKVGPCSLGETGEVADDPSGQPGQGRFVGSNHRGGVSAAGIGGRRQDPDGLLGEGWGAGNGDQKGDQNAVMPHIALAPPALGSSRGTRRSRCIFLAGPRRGGAARGVSAGSPNPGRPLGIARTNCRSRSRSELSPDAADLVQQVAERILDMMLRLGGR